MQIIEFGYICFAADHFVSMGMHPSEKPDDPEWVLVINLTSSKSLVIRGPEDEIKPAYAEILGKLVEPPRQANTAGSDISQTSTSS